MKALWGKRIIVCGKGGTGKSTMTALLARALERSHYQVVLLDSDASNPSGLSRMVFGGHHHPAPLIEYFGGRAHVSCPVDDPSPLLRLNNGMTLTEAPLRLDELPPKYYRRRGNTTLLQVGKMTQFGEGCDGPMAKITRDFRIEGNAVTLIDLEAGIEHFGRSVEQHNDIVLIVVNPVYDAVQIAQRISKICHSMSIANVYALINAVESEKMEEILNRELRQRKIAWLGAVKYDDKVQMAGLAGKDIGDCAALSETLHLVRLLEQSINEPNIHSLEESAHY